MAETVDQKLLKQTKFPPEFSKKVDMQKVNIEVMKKWIASKISDILGNEDDVVIELCFNLLEGSRFPSIKVLQIQLTGFLEKETPAFCKELWKLCISAQSNPQGVPKELLEAKKLELIQEKIQAEKAAEDARRLREQEQQRDKEIEELRQRERGERSEQGRGRGRRGPGRDLDRSRRNSRSPRRRSPDEYRGPPPRRQADTYIPSNSRDERIHRPSPPLRRPNSPSRSRSRSESPRQRRYRKAAPRSRSRSRSITPPRRRKRYSRASSRERSHSRYRGRRSDNWSYRRHRRDYDRDASFTPYASSSSPSPRRHRHRRRSFTSPSRSPSPSPPMRKYEERRRRRYRSRSRSLSRSLPRHLSPRRDRPSRAFRDSIRSRRSPSESQDDTYSRHADIRKERARSDRAPKKERRRSPSPSLRERKRHRSIERYEPRPKRRRNTSSPEPDHHQSKSFTGSSTEHTGSSQMQDDGDAKEGEESKSSTAKTTALREKLLKERLIAQRRRSSVDSPK